VTGRGASCRRLGVDAVEFGWRCSGRAAPEETFSAERAVKADLKEYRAGDTLAAIGQVETVDVAEVMEHAVRCAR
jgi:inorganic pyrophosphatase/exopolyphosphatase